MAPAISTLRGAAVDYWPYLVMLMTYHHDYAYNPKEQEMWEPKLLTTLTPEIIEGWMNKTVFGTASPGPDDKPVYGRSSSLEFAKKAISYFMPNRLLGWNVTTNNGNPTKLIVINDLIKRVKKMEVRQQGKASNVKRASTRPEFRLMLRMMEDQGSFVMKYRFTTMKKLQFTIIGRVDDTSNFETRDLHGHPEHDFALSTKVKWAKNVLEEWDCPN